MASRTWNIQLANGGFAQVEIFGNRKVSINGREATKLKEFHNKKESSFFEKVYDIPLSLTETAKFYVQNFSSALTYKGIDLDTGEERRSFKPPFWFYIFCVLYIVEFSALLGGALGGFLYGAAATLGFNVCRKQNYKTVSKVMLNVLIFFVTTLISFGTCVVAGLLLQ